MKKIFSLLMLLSVASVTMLTSCGQDDKFTDTIFPTDGKPYDPNAKTAAFDKWCYENFLLPYNTVIDYRMYFPASNMDYQLTPADYNKSVILTQLIKYLFYDLYVSQAGTEFMRTYGPRQFHYIGSVAYDATNGSRTLGYASGGVMITLMNVNSVADKTVWTPEDVEMLNHEIFHTMHHEFSHILQQSKTQPVAFRRVTPNTYEPQNWGDRDSLDVQKKGYVTNYSSSSDTEDFVEVLSCIITDLPGNWMHRIVNGCLDGVSPGVKEQIYTLIDSLDIDVNMPGADWHKFTVYEEFDKEGTSLGRSTSIYERWRNNGNARQKQMANAHHSLSDDFDHQEVVATFNSFDEFMNWVTVDNSDEVRGISSVIKKIELASEWYTKNFGLHVFDLRHKLFKRQDELNNWFATEYKAFPVTVEE